MNYKKIFISFAHLAIYFWLFQLLQPYNFYAMLTDRYNFLVMYIAYSFITNVMLYAVYDFKLLNQSGISMSLLAAFTNFSTLTVSTDTWYRVFNILPNIITVVIIFYIVALNIYQYDLSLGKDFDSHLFDNGKPTSKYLRILYIIFSVIALIFNTLLVMILLACFYMILVLSLRFIVIFIIQLLSR